MRSTALPPALRLRAVLLASALWACTSTGSSPASAGAGAALTCSSDAECQAGFKCDRESRACVCTGDAACPAGQFCNAFTGQCVASVPGCTSSASCQAGQFCNRALRSCQAVTATCGKCKGDDECGSGSRCAVNPAFPTAGTFCAPSCSGAAACAAGYTCNSSAGLCVPSQGACGTTNLCVPDTLAACAKDVDCADAAQQCDVSLKGCVAKNRSCPAGDACDPQQRVCVHACQADTDCKLIEGAAGYRCRNNACFKLATCTSDADCSSANKQICTANPDGSKSCAPGCVKASDCPLGQGCNNDPSHPRCTAQCGQSADCPLNAVCNSGACVSTFASCAQACQATPACAVGASCSSNGCCVGGAVADFKALCPKGCALSVPGNCYAVPGADCSSGGQQLCDARYLPVGSTTCKAFGTGIYCVADLQFKACSGDADCPYKGFHCAALGGAQPLCLPYEAPAVDACLAAH
jgi:hypothetical protein